MTIVAYHRQPLFGEIVHKKVILNNYGKIAEECWQAIPNHFPHVELGAYVIMPNHVHGLIVITGERRDAAMLRPCNNHHSRKINVQPGSLGAIVRSYKSAVSYRLNKEQNATAIWQRNYYEHIIRDETDLQNKTCYIEANPLLWEKDNQNPVDVK